MRSADASLSTDSAARPQERPSRQMNWRGLRRLPLFALALALPSAAVLGGLCAAGHIGPRPALGAVLAIFLLLALSLMPLALSLAAVHEAIETIGPGAEPGAEIAATRRLGNLGGSADAIWQAAARLARGWRERSARAEARLAAAEAVFAAIPDPQILLDSHRRIVRANPAATEFVGSVLEGSDLAASLRNPAVLAAADAVLAGGPARIVDFTLSLPVERVMQARIARVDGVATEGIAAILTLHDITALKLAEQMRADFVANAGHELKTPLASLVGFIETLLGAARDDPAARERFLGIMHGEAGRMTRLVDDLLSLSRIELNEHVAPTSRVALAMLIEQVADALELRAAARGMRLVLQVPDELPEVHGDEDELAQVFQNLIDNAIKYGRPNTEITVTGAVEARLPATNALVRVAVTDRGEGIPSEHLPRLTERFYRVDTARSRELGGTGLGLAIVKHIVNRHRGRLEISSTLGTGSTFTVCLQPAARGRLASVTEAQQN
ncbi:MAG TPA: ATP-binding protein [Stellaceae bacterium]|jgi:two-component system phosphate regulon sensor histidine kinase PhoR|nr:ATP-binding protein [Stellaceae bacterium]